MASDTLNIDLEEKHYDPSTIEVQVRRYWDESGMHLADPTSGKPAYCIMIPPPNVTGRLHMGHALNNTIQDVLIRYKRMNGFDTLWVPGTDHAGISTQSVVKKQLDAEGIDYQELGREKTIERIWQWKEKYGGHILTQLSRLGCSCDWSRTRFTMDDNLSYAVRVAFKNLFDAGLIYRGKYIVNWCPSDKTALSDDEVETKDGGEPGHLWYFKYPLKDSSDFITVATTRPETMLGDTAVAVNPKDERFAPLVGKTLILPLVGREIPIIADDFVDPEFGTGCVKVTPAHDPNDFQMGLRHNLEQINIMHEDASLNENVPEQFQGLDRFVARKEVVAAMDAAGLLEKIEDRMTPVGRSYRSKQIIEYRLSDQWFVKMGPLAEKALEASEAGKVQWFPERWDPYYRDWLKKTRDWCISRQLWWGHRIPAWHNKESGEILVDIDTPAIVEENPDAWYQDEDVLDTWFSSALWPYSTLGWPHETEDLKTYYPTNVLVTAKDIIFFWVARMVMTGLFNIEEVPFHHVLINSTICDEDGETMSKSKGNGIDPLHVIDGATTEELTQPIFEARPANMEKLLARIEKRFPDGFTGVGADALRYTMLTSATDAQQMQVSLKKFDELGRRLSDKIWNASKLVLGNIQNAPATDELAEPALEDRWILGALDQTVAKTREAIEKYTFHHASDSLYHFFWDDICDWYLEISKPRLRDGSPAEQRRVLLTLGEVLGGFLRLAHPVIPFITEAMWSKLHAELMNHRLFPAEDSELEASSMLATAPYPIDKGRFDEELARSFSLIQELVRAARAIRADTRISPKDSLEAVVRVSDPSVTSLLNETTSLICALANLKSFTISDSKPSGFSSSVLQGLELFLNTAEHMDIDAEIARTKLALEKVVKTLSGIEGKLRNKGFVENAPEQVVNAEREKQEEASKQKEKLESSLSDLEKLRA